MVNSLTETALPPKPVRNPRPAAASVGEFIIFPQIAGGVDEATWLFCIERRDVSRWIRDAIEDKEPISEANRA